MDINTDSSRARTTGPDMALGHEDTMASGGSSGLPGLNDTRGSLILKDQQGLRCWPRLHASGVSVGPSVATEAKDVNSEPNHRRAVAPGSSSGWQWRLLRQAFSVGAHPSHTNLVTPCVHRALGGGRSHRHQHRPLPPHHKDMTLGSSSDPEVIMAPASKQSAYLYQPVPHQPFLSSSTSLPSYESFCLFLSPMSSSYTHFAWSPSTKDSGHRVPRLILHTPD